MPWIPQMPDVDATPRDADGNPIEPEPRRPLPTSKGSGYTGGYLFGGPIPGTVSGGLTPDQYIDIAQGNIPEAAVPEEYAPGDILKDQFERYISDLGVIRGDALGEAGRYADELSGLGQAYGDTVRGSDGYGGLEGYRDEMQALYDAGGLTDVTKANLESSRRDADQWLRGQREASLQDLAERGMAGGGAELLSSIGARSAAADRMSARDLETNAFAQEQALQALMNAKDTSGELFDIDRGIADTQLGYDTQGADTRYGVSDAFTKTATAAYNDLFGNAVQLGGDAWTGASGDVAGATEGAKGTLAGASAAGRDNASAAVDRNTSQLTNAGFGLWGSGEGAPPPMNTLGPPVPQTPVMDVGPDVAALAGGIAGAVTENPSEKEEDE